MKWTDANPQPLPKGLFEDTVLIDLNLKGNNLTNTQLVSTVRLDLYCDCYLFLQIILILYDVITSRMIKRIHLMALRLFLKDARN